MEQPVLISICVPAYKRIEYLKRLLNSIANQTFKNFELIITDDSPDLNVAKFVKNFKGIEKLNYYRNVQPLGTPENWNESIRKANGKWIKLMHDDDWFASEESLQIFFEAIEKSKNCPFIFSAHNNVDETSGNISAVHMEIVGKLFLLQSPINLMKRQYIGAPSNTLIRKDVELFYDRSFKWVVDFEFYIRCLRQTKCFYYIDKTLINIGLNKEQVTKYTFRNPEIEIPENHLMIETLGSDILGNIFVYDYYWRFYRNLNITNVESIKELYHKPINPLLKQIIHFQSKFSYRLLQLGFVSKFLMIISYCFSKLKKDDVPVKLE